MGKYNKHAVSVLSGDTNASAGTYDELAAAPVNGKDRTLIRIQNPSTNTSEVITLGVGESGSEVAIATLEAGQTFELKVSEVSLDNFVPQGRIAIKSSSGTTAFLAILAESV